MSLLIVIIALALIFDYINGFHDAANSIATVVSTKVLTPFQAVLWAALFNVVAFFIFKDHAVANSISKTVFKDFITLPVIFSGLLAAIFWNLLTWWYGIPSSSSHTLIGGFAGAAIAHALMVKGIDYPWSKIVDSHTILMTVFFIFLAPIIGINPEVGHLVLKALVAAVIGGFTSLPGAVVGGLLLGLIETYSGAFFGSTAKNILPFVVLVVFLLVRPYGLFGRAPLVRI